MNGRYTHAHYRLQATTLNDAERRDALRAEARRRLRDSATGILTLLDQADHTPAEADNPGWRAAVSNTAACCVTEAQNLR